MISEKLNLEDSEFVQFKIVYKLMDISISVIAYKFVLSIKKKLIKSSFVQSYIYWLI